MSSQVKPMTLLIIWRHSIPALWALLTRPLTSGWFGDGLTDRLEAFMTLWSTDYPFYNVLFVNLLLVDSYSEAFDWSIEPFWGWLCSWGDPATFLSMCYTIRWWSWSCDWPSHRNLTTFRMLHKSGLHAFDDFFQEASLGGCSLILGLNSVVEKKS